MRDIGRKTPIFHTPFHLTCTITHCVSKNAPTLASSSFDKHGLILIIVGKQHQHTFRIWYGCSTFFVPSLLLTVFAFKQLRRKWRVLASLYARKTVQLFCRNTGLYLAGSVSAKQSGWLQNLWTNAGTCTKTCPRYQPLWPATWTRASLTHGHCKHITKGHQQSSWSMEKAVTCKHEGKMASLWTSAKLKAALFRATNSLPRKMRRFALFPSQLFKSK